MAASSNTPLETAAPEPATAGRDVDRFRQARRALIGLGAFGALGGRQAEAQIRVPRASRPITVTPGELRLLRYIDLADRKLLGSQPLYDRLHGAARLAAGVGELNERRVAGSGGQRGQKHEMQAAGHGFPPWIVRRGSRGRAGQLPCWCVSRRGASCRGRPFLGSSRRVSEPAELRVRRFAEGAMCATARNWARAVFGELALAA